MRQPLAERGAVQKETVSRILSCGQRVVEICLRSDSKEVSSDVH